jgi:hypothetical protein
MACAIEIYPPKADKSATGGKDSRIDFSSGTWSVWVELGGSVLSGEVLTIASDFIVTL